MLETNMIKGKIFIIRLGMYKLVRINGKNMFTSIFLKTLFLQINLK